MKTTNLFKLIFLMIAMWTTQIAVAQTGQYCIGDARNQVGTNVKVLPDGTGSIIAGYNYDIDPSGNVINANMLLMKVNPAGTAIIWQQEFGIAGTNNLVQNMIITHDGNIVVVGTIGRNAVFGANIAAIMKFRSSDGVMMWQNSVRDAVHTTGGEMFFGVTELGAAGNYDLVAVGGHDFRPYFNSSMVCVYQSNGVLKYEEDRRIPWGGSYSSNNYYGICTAANGTDVYTCSIFRGTYADVRIDMYRPNVTATSGNVMWSRSFNYVLPGVVLLNGGAVPGGLNLQNNFAVNIYLAGNQLLIHGGSLNNFTTTGGAGESIMRMAADGTGSVELWQIQNSSVDYANTSKIAVVNADHIFNVQMPHTSWIDPIIWLAGAATNSVITEVTSLTGNGVNSTINTPVRYTTPTGGIHAMFDITLDPGRTRLELTGSTTDGINFGANDIYYLRTPVALPRYDCNEDDRGGTVVVPLTPVTPTYIDEQRTMETVTVNVAPTNYAIRTLCEQKQQPCYSDAHLTYVTTTDSAGNCVYTVTASATTAHTIAGYEWTLPGGTVMIYSSAATNSQTFTVPIGGSFHLSVRIFIVRSTWEEGEGPCCEVKLDKEFDCRQQQNWCFDESQTYVEAVSVPGPPDIMGISCLFTITAHAVPLPGWTVVGYEFRIGGGAAPIIPGNSIVVPVGAYTASWVEIVIYAVNAAGDTCTITRILTLNCENGAGTSARPGKGGDKDVKEMADQHISVFPNPTDGKVKITSTGAEINSVQVIDINGKQLSDNSFKNTKSAEISLSGFAPGTYLVRVNGHNSKMIVKSE